MKSKFSATMARAKRLDELGQRDRPSRVNKFKLRHYHDWRTLSSLMIVPAAGWSSNKKTAGSTDGPFVDSCGVDALDFALAV
jgi:hypothetical protein